MEAVIIVLLVALLAVAGVAVVMLAQRRPAHETDAQRLEQQAEARRLDQQLGALKSEITQAVGAAQQTVLSQVNALEGRFNQRLDAVQSDVTKTLSSTTETIGNIAQQLTDIHFLSFYRLPMPGMEHPQIRNLLHIYM